MQLAGLSQTRGGASAPGEPLLEETVDAINLHWLKKTPPIRSNNGRKIHEKLLKARAAPLIQEILLLPLVQLDTVLEECHFTWFFSSYSLQ